MISFHKACFKRAKQRLVEHGRTQSEIHRIIFAMTSSSELVWKSKIQGASLHLVALNKMTLEWDSVNQGSVMRLLPDGLHCRCLACHKEISIEDSFGDAGDGWVSEWWVDRNLGVIGDQEICPLCRDRFLVSLPHDRPCLRPEFQYDPITRVIRIKNGN